MYQLRSLIRTLASPLSSPLTLSLCLILLLPIGLLAQASTATSGQESEKEDDSQEETFDEVIVVTAQKREQNLEDVPMSLSAISEEAIEDSGLSGIQDLSQMAPGLIFAETIGRQTASPSIRGVTPFGFADPTVQVLIDGFTLGFNRSGNNATLFDLERIEVLRGPQSNLYGRNAIGGVINFITRSPTGERRGKLSLEAGTRDSYLAQGSIGGALVEEKLFGSVAIGYRSSGGFMDNTVTGRSNVNDEEDLNGRLRLSLVPTSKLAVNLTVDYNEADDAAGDPSHVPPAFFSANPPSLADVARGAVNFNDFDRTISQDVLGGFERDETSVVLNVAYQFGSSQLTSITGYADQFTDVSTDVTRTPGPSFFGDFFNVPIDNQGFSQELRIASTADSRLQWLVGAYYFENERDRRLTFNGGPLIQDSTGTVDNSAVFVNLEYSITDNLFLGGGLRFDREDRTERNNLAATEDSADFDEVLPTVTLSYRPQDRNYHLYATISEGYHAGGPNAAASVAAGAPGSYDSEFVTNYEIGLKGTSASRKFGYETSVFYMDWTDQQIQTSLTPLLGFISNAGESEIKGIELSGRYSPLPGLNLNLGLSLLDTEYTDYVDAISAAPFGIDPQLAGNDLVYAADISGSLSAQYIRALGGGDWYLRLRGDMNHVGERSFDVTNLLTADAYTIFNFYFGVQKDQFEVGLYADNAFDEDYLTGGILPSLFFPPLLTVGDPSVYGVRAKFGF